MAGYLKHEVRIVTEYKDGCVFRTKVKEVIWLKLETRTVEEDNLIALRHGGDMLVVCGGADALQFR